MDDGYVSIALGNGQGGQGTGSFGTYQLYNVGPKAQALTKR